MSRTHAIFSLFMWQCCGAVRGLPALASQVQATRVYRGLITHGSSVCYGQIFVKNSKGEEQSLSVDFFWKTRKRNYICGDNSSAILAAAGHGLVCLLENQL